MEDDGSNYYVIINGDKHIILPNAIIYKKGGSDDEYIKLGTIKQNAEIRTFQENTFFIKNHSSQYEHTGGRKSKRSRKSYSSKKRALKSKRIRKSSRRYSRRR